MVPAPQSRKMHSVFFTIFFSLLLVLVIELTLLIGTIIVGQVPSQLDDNAEEVLCEQVENRSGYLQNFLVSSQELTALSTYINSQTEALLADGTISLDTLDCGSAGSAGSGQCRIRAASARHFVGAGVRNARKKTQRHLCYFLQPRFG